MQAAGTFVFENKQNKTAMASRFGVADSDVIQDLKASSENRNTRKSTNLWVGVFKKWAAYRNMGENLETYKVEELDEVLSRFYAEVRKTNGEEYEPDCLKVMQASLDRFLREEGSSKSILMVMNFSTPEKCLKERQRNSEETVSVNSQIKQKALPMKKRKYCGKAASLEETTHAH